MNLIKIISMEKEKRYSSNGPHLAGLPMAGSPCEQGSRGAMVGWRRRPNSAMTGGEVVGATARVTQQGREPI
jgi:hypothetical protein